MIDYDRAVAEWILTKNPDLVKEGVKAEDIHHIEFTTIAPYCETCCSASMGINFQIKSADYDHDMNYDKPAEFIKEVSEIIQKTIMEERVKTGEDLQMESNFGLDEKKRQSLIHEKFDKFHGIKAKWKSKCSTCEISRDVGDDIYIHRKRKGSIYCFDCAYALAVKEA